jgi:putative spermidine/putrescine transport system permease protein
VLARAASTLGADPKSRFGTSIRCAGARAGDVLLPRFVQAFSVFPSAVLRNGSRGPTRVISIAAYEAAFEQYDYSLASAIAMIMGFVH